MEYYLVVSTFMMFAGIYGFFTRRNLLAMLISVELILNSVDINFAVFNRFLFPEELEGFFFALFAGYGRQRGWERIPSCNELPDNKDGFVELTEEEVRQLELPKEWIA